MVANLVEAGLHDGRAVLAGAARTLEMIWARKCVFIAKHQKCRSVPLAHIL